jgi:predicted NAD-dependent protein-ADP-ribosyltransferase YbiA (DUF1768 family)
MTPPLFTEDAVFMFHSRSADAPPGTGAGESLALPAETFRELASTPGWRRALSNFSESPFVLDDLRWKSVEHCFQAAKFASIEPDYHRSFSLDSGSELSRADGGDVKRAGGRRGRPLGPAELAWWDSVKHGTMGRALFAKYSQNDRHRAILLATKLAKLTHRPLRSAHTIVEMELMAVRQRLAAG